MFDLERDSTVSHTWLRTMVRRMPVGEAIVTMLEMPTVFGPLTVGTVLDLLECPLKTLDNNLPILVKSGRVIKDASRLGLPPTLPRPIIDPILGPSTTQARPDHDPATARDGPELNPKSGNTVTAANNAILTDVSLGEGGEEGVGLKAFDLAVDVEVQNQDQQQVQDQTQKPASASAHATPATSSPQPVNPEPRAVPFRSVRPPIPKPIPKLEQPKKPEPEKPEREETEHEAIFAALALTCYGGTGNLTKTVAGRIAGAAKQLRSAGYSAEDVGEINIWITTFEAWRGLVTPQTIVERAPAWGNDLKPASAPKPINPNTQHRSHHLRADVQLERLRREREAAAQTNIPTVEVQTVTVRQTQSAFPPQPLPGGPR